MRIAAFSVAGEGGLVDAGAKSIVRFDLPVLEPARRQSFDRAAVFIRDLGALAAQAGHARSSVAAAAPH